SFPEEEIEKEKNVVIEEMKMYRDSPRDYLLEEFVRQSFENHPLGRSTLGSEETVSSFKRQDLYAYMEGRYQPSNLLVAVAGNTNHQQVVDLVEEVFSGIESKELKELDQSLSEYSAKKTKLTKAIEQTHLVMGRRGLDYDHPDKYRLLLANTILGGGMSSRLHQNVREQYGYCYTISTINQSYEDTGIFGIYAGTDEEYVDHVEELAIKELERLQQEQIRQKELDEAKAQLKGKLMLSLESMSNRMARLAKSELYHGRFITQDELVQKIDAVEREEVQNFAQTFFHPDEFSKSVLVPK